MESIIRSLFQLGQVPDIVEAHKNWLTYQEYKTPPQVQQDVEILAYIDQFYNSLGAPPDFTIIRDYFESDNKAEVVSRLDEIKSAHQYIGANFMALARKAREEHQLREFLRILKEAASIAEHGKIVGRGVPALRGVNDAYRRFNDMIQPLLLTEDGRRTAVLATEESENVLSRYETREKNPHLNDHNLFGLEPVDVAIGGHKRKKLWIHAAFVGQLKTTVALNYAYNNAYVYQRNIFYAMLEMDVDTFMDQLYVVHSSHGKFVTQWAEEDRRAGRKVYTGVDFKEVSEGRLSELNKKRFIQVAQDFRANCKGEIKVWRPNGAAKVSDIAHHAGEFNTKFGCDGLVIDYLGLVAAATDRDNPTDRINGVVQDVARLANDFDRGRGVPILGLFQMNRQGHERAVKADGHYDISSLAQSNQVERDADIITYTYLNERDRHEGSFQMGCLKNRYGAHFDHFAGKILWHSKRMRSINNNPLVLEKLGVTANTVQFARDMDIIT